MSDDFTITKEEIKKLLEQKLSFLSQEMRKHLNNIKEEKGIQGLIDMKEWLDNTDGSDALRFSGDEKEIKKIVADASKADAITAESDGNKDKEGNEDTFKTFVSYLSNINKPTSDTISEGDNLFASKIDTNAFDSNNNPSTIYRGEYFYLINKDEYNSYLSSAINKKTTKKHDFILDNDTFMNNFVTINKESVEPFMDEDCDVDNCLMCSNCGGVSYHFGLTENFECPYCNEWAVYARDKKEDDSATLIRKNGGISSGGGSLIKTEPADAGVDGSNDGGNMGGGL